MNTIFFSIFIVLFNINIIYKSKSFVVQNKRSTKSKYYHFDFSYLFCRLVKNVEFCNIKNNYNKN